MLQTEKMDNSHRQTGRFDRRSKQWIKQSMSCYMACYCCSPQMDLLLNWKHVCQWVAGLFDGFGVHYWFFFALNELVFCFCTKNGPNLAFYDFFLILRKKESMWVKRVCYWWLKQSVLLCYLMPLAWANGAIRLKPLNPTERHRQRCWRSRV